MTGHPKRMVEIAGVVGSQPRAVMRATLASVSSKSQGGPKIAATS